MTPSKWTAGRVLLNVALVLFLAACIFPVLWMISSSLKSADELFSSEIYLIPKRITMDHYLEVFASYAIGDWFKNSLATTVGISLLQILVSFLAAFALSYFHTRLNSAVTFFLLITMVIPFQVTMIPNYILVSGMKLLNTWTSVILPNVANATTFFYLYQNTRGVPRAYYECAHIEGAGSFWAMCNVTWGLCKGAVSAICILTVIEAWNLYFWPLLVLTRPESRTLTIGLKQFLDFEMGNRWGPFMATATLASLPVMIVYAFLQRHIINAFISSGIKG
jgi:sn-glycerol 3-phosphate transport system permease protein